MVYKFFHSSSPFLYLIRFSFQNFFAFPFSKTSVFLKKFSANFVFFLY
ncbi:hypothetical protein C095_03895 [Fusobacterium necrophorum subsp. funduliforme B35]|uniref:Uncharacterized protein n=1 Tax=Fusobacterium necrophorum subsp. funduliforme B35 TaxID=1226633 RepID=A0A0B4EQS0_9FUSO|nr:hypothetical protein C095_03895 [Fusobacterium necrophorum subsp. funduliforme B35]